jgi:pyruvate/2-oxoacid:ferredoxin oxidoreductase alpha subunit
MLDGTVIAANIASIFALPIISALRAFIEEDKWKIPIQELLPQIADELWKDYSAYLRKNWDKEQRNLTGTLRNEEVWINLHVSATEFQTRYLRNCLARKSETNGQNPTQVKEINKALS